MHKQFAIISAWVIGSIAVCCNASSLPPAQNNAAAARAKIAADNNAHLSLGQQWAQQFNKLKEEHINSDESYAAFANKVVALARTYDNPVEALRTILEGVFYDIPADLNMFRYSIEEIQKVEQTALLKRMLKRKDEDGVNEQQQFEELKRIYLARKQAIQPHCYAHHILVTLTHKKLFQGLSSVYRPKSFEKEATRLLVDGEEDGIGSSLLECAVMSELPAIYNDLAQKVQAPESRLNASAKEAIEKDLDALRNGFLMPFNVSIASFNQSDITPQRLAHVRLQVEKYRIRIEQYERALRSEIKLGLSLQLVREGLALERERFDDFLVSEFRVYIANNDHKRVAELVQIALDCGNVTILDKMAKLYKEMNSINDTPRGLEESIEYQFKSIQLMEASSVAPEEKKELRKRIYQVFCDIQMLGQHHGTDIPALRRVLYSYNHMFDDQSYNVNFTDYEGAAYAALQIANGYFLLGDHKQSKVYMQEATKHLDSVLVVLPASGSTIEAFSGQKSYMSPIVDSALMLWEYMPYLICKALSEKAQQYKAVREKNIYFVKN